MITKLSGTICKFQCFSFQYRPAIILKLSTDYQAFRTNNFTIKQRSRLHEIFWIRSRLHSRPIARSTRIANLLWLLAIANKFGGNCSATAKLIDIWANLLTSIFQNYFRETPLPPPCSPVLGIAGIKSQNNRAFLDVECIIRQRKALYQATETNCVAQCSFLSLIREKCLVVSG